MPFESKKLINRVLPTLISRLTIWGGGSSLPSHWLDWLRCSGSYKYSQVSSMVTTLVRKVGNRCSSLSRATQASSLCLRFAGDSRCGTNLAVFLTRCRSFLRIVWTVDLDRLVCTARARTLRRLSAVTSLFTAAMFALDLPLITLASLWRSTKTVLPLVKALCQYLILQRLIFTQKCMLILWINFGESSLHLFMSPNWQQKGTFHRRVSPTRNYLLDLGTVCWGRTAQKVSQDRRSTPISKVIPTCRSTDTVARTWTTLVQQNSSLWFGRFAGVVLRYQVTSRPRTLIEGPTLGRARLKHWNLLTRMNTRTGWQKFGRREILFFFGESRVGFLPHPWVSWRKNNTRWTWTLRTKIDASYSHFYTRIKRHYRSASFTCQQFTYLQDLFTQIKLESTQVTQTQHYNLISAQEYLWWMKMWVVSASYSYRACTHRHTLAPVLSHTSKNTRETTENKTSCREEFHKVSWWQREQPSTCLYAPNLDWVKLTGDEKK